MNWNRPIGNTNRALFAIGLYVYKSVIYFFQIFEGHYKLFYDLREWRNW